MKNKVFITGAPRMGKTTLMDKVLEEIKNKKGFVTREILENGERTGFQIVTPAASYLLSSKKIVTNYAVESTHPPGTKYYVDVPGFEKALEPLFQINKEELLYLDEVGQMEFFSDKFRRLFLSYLTAPNTLIATLSTAYRALMEEYARHRKEILILELTAENRAQVLEQVRKICIGQANAEQVRRVCPC